MSHLLKFKYPPWSTKCWSMSCSKVFQALRLSVWLPAVCKTLFICLSAIYVNAAILHKTYRTESISLPRFSHPVMGWQWIMHILSQAFNYFYKSINWYWLRAGWSGDRIPVGGEIFCTCPDRPWGPPNLLYNGYWVLPGGKEQLGCDTNPSPPSSAMIKKG